MSELVLKNIKKKIAANGRERIDMPHRYFRILSVSGGTELQITSEGTPNPQTIYAGISCEFTDDDDHRKQQYWIQLHNPTGAEIEVEILLSTNPTGDNRLTLSASSINTRSQATSGSFGKDIAVDVTASIASNGNRKSIEITNTGTVPLYIRLDEGADSGTTPDGYPLAVGNSIELTTTQEIHFYNDTSKVAGAQKFDYLQESH